MAGKSLNDIKPTASGDAVYRLAVGLLRPLYKLPLSVEVKGQDKLPREGGYIVVSNHVTVVDPITVGYPLVNQGTLPRYLAKESLFRVPLLGWLMRRCAHIPVARGSAQAAKSLDVARKVIDSGGAVIIFPEGTLTKDPDLWPMTGKSGAARLALQTGAPIIPIAHWGDQEFWPPEQKPRFRLRRTKVHISIGDPIDLSDLHAAHQDETPYSREAIKTATNRMLDSITDLLQDIRGEEAPQGRWNSVLGLREHPQP